VTPAGRERIGRVRWVICALLFAATAVNYIDRQAISVLKPRLQHGFGWNEIDYAQIVFWFQAAYAVGYLGFGWLIDRIGARLGYALSAAIWCAAHIAHAFVGSLTGFIGARVVLGFGESGMFPASLKAVTEWFPKTERALAAGVFNAGTNIGAILTPAIALLVTQAFGLDWRWVFIVTGALTLVWLVAWIAIYRTPDRYKGLGAAELAFIRSDPPDLARKTPWLSLLGVRETWAYALGKFLIDPIWWMFLFWMPDFFAKRYHLDLAGFGPALVVVYIVSDVGSIGGGWISSALLKRGVSLNAARKWTMLGCAVAVLPIMAGMYVDSLWTAVAIIGLATAAHQAFSCNLYTLPSDVFPRNAVASVVGIGGTAGAIGGMLMAQGVGWVLQTVHSYTPIFVVAGTIYFIALGVVHLLCPRYEPARLAVAPGETPAMPISA
jgi:ACS family hexuronate transporter-like MFS transporter